MFLKDICTWWIPNIFYFFCFYSVWTEVKNLQIAITFSTSLSLRTTAGMKRFLLKIPANIRKCINVLCISVLTVLLLRPQWRSGTGDSFQRDKSWKPTWSQGFLLAAAGHHNTVWVQTSSQQCKNDAQQRVTRGGWYQAVYKGKKKTQLWVCLKTELHILLWPAEMSLWLFLWSVCYGLFCADHNVDQFARAWEWCSLSALHTINTMETCPVLAMYACGYFPADKKLQEQRTKLLFDAKIKTSLRILKHMLHLCLLTQAHYFSVQPFSPSWTSTLVTNI